MTSTLFFGRRRVEEDPSWRTDAACKGRTDLFFPKAQPHRGRMLGNLPDLEVRRVREAKAICAGCPVRRDCLAYAVTHRETFGVWGGLDERELSALIRRSA